MPEQKNRSVLIAPSILAADFLQLGEQIKQCEAAGADLIHCDVMDGHFVPNLTFGPPIIKQLHGVTSLPLDVHLMINAPERSVAWYHDAGAAAITVHQEVSPHLNRTLQFIRSLGIKAGVSINPATPATTLQHVLELADIILVMTVNPGFGGQKFIESMLDKIELLATWRTQADLRYSIAVDGGIDRSTTARVVEAGADTLIAGTAVFAGDVSANIRALREAAAC